MADPTTQLATLRKLRAITTDPTDQVNLDTMIAQLEASQPQRTHTQTISDEAQVGIAIAGDANAPVTTIEGDQRNINTGGGDYTEGNLDKRRGVFIDQLVQVFFQASGIPDPTTEQRELLTSYLYGLIRRCDRLRIAGIVDWERKHGKAPAFTLSDLYIALASTEWQTIDQADTADAFAEDLAAGNADTVLPRDARRVTEPSRMEGMGLGDRRGAAEIPPFRLERPVLVTEVLCKTRHIVLLGGPGSGKSTFLRHLAVALAHAETQGTTVINLPGWDAGLVLPIFASLGAYAAWADGSADRLTLDGLWTFLLTQSEGVMLDGLATQVKAAFRQRRLLLLLDGLDEVADPALRARVAVVVARLADAQGYVVITCRVRSFEGAVAKPFVDWGDPVQLAPFTLGQIRHFVRGWYERGVAQNAINAPLAEQRANELSERIATLKELRDLAETPLLLTIMTILHYYEGKLPDDRADLYEDMTQLLLTRWTAQRREAGAGPSLIEQLRSAEPRLSGLSDYQIRSVLESLAYRAHLAKRTPDGRGLLERGVVREAFIKLFGNFNLDDAQDGSAGKCAALVLRYLEEESGLLLHEGGDLYGLPHLTYEEYLAACYLAKQKGKPEFRTIAYQHWREDAGRWREVIFLALGRMVRGDDRDIAAGWLNFLLMQSHGTRKRDLLELHQAALFAGECLREIGGKAKLSDATIIDLGLLWQHLAQHLAEVVEGTHLPAKDRVRAGVLLGESSDPRHGVCDLPPRMIKIEGGEIVYGLLPEEVDPYTDQFVTDYRAAGYSVEDSQVPLYKQAFTTWVGQQSKHVHFFELARYPITNAQWQLFIDADGYNPDQPWWDAAGQMWLKRDDAATAGLEAYQKREYKDRPEWWNDERFGIVLPNHPVVGITWYEATAFAKWLTSHLDDGYTYCLPSELEWEYAARGTECRRYPWKGDQIDGEYANHNQLYNGTSAVGCFANGTTPEGLTDMAGNVWEWTRSEYRPYPYDPADGREDETEPANKRFTLRGGSWLNLPIDLRASSRIFYTPDSRDDGVGVRLARRSSL